VGLKHQYSRVGKKIRNEMSWWWFCGVFYLKDFEIIILSKIRLNYKMLYFFNLIEHIYIFSLSDSTKDQS